MAEELQAIAPGTCVAVIALCRQVPPRIRDTVTLDRQTRTDLAKVQGEP